MIDLLLRTMVKALLWLRYRVEARGLAQIAARGTQGILFLLSDPRAETVEGQLVSHARDRMVCRRSPMRRLP